MMIALLVALNFYFNFCMGALLPIVPRLSPETAGWAFTVFSLFKVICLVPAGTISDRLGHGRAMALAITLQVGALVTIASIPTAPWAGRILEGAALAQGTVSTLALLRIASANVDELARRMRMLLGIGSMGFLFGPMAGYFALGSALMPPERLLSGLAVIGALAIVLQLRFVRRFDAVEREREATPHAPSGADTFWLGLALAMGKVLGVGWQPLLAWWANHEMGLSPGQAGASFVAIGIAFGVGATQLRRLPFAVVAGVVVAGFGLLEYAVAHASFHWWIAVVLVSAWFGDFLTRTMALLGWSDPARLGATNARWLAITDLPMALTPAIVWPIRTAPYWIPRCAIAAAALALAIGGYFVGTRVRAMLPRGST
jgi:MFS family permease